MVLYITCQFDRCCCK